MTAEPGKSKADKDSESKDEPANGSGTDSGKTAQATKTAGGVSGDGATSVSGGVATGQGNGGNSNGSAGKKVVAAGTPREEARVNVPPATPSEVTRIDGVKPVTDGPAEQDKSAADGTTAGSISGTAGAGAGMAGTAGVGAAGMGTMSPASGRTTTSAAGSAQPASPAASGPSPLSPALSPAQPMGRPAGAAPAFGGGQPIGSGSPSPGTTQTAGAATESRGGKAGGQGGATSGKNPRKAHLQLARLEPWSVMKFSFVMSLVAFIVLLVAVVVLWVVLSGLGVFDAISSTVNDLTRDQGDTTGALDAASWFAFTRVFGYTVLVGAVNVLLITALSTVGSVMYNTAADLVGGVEVTLKEAE